jgi:hypothetical protein
MVDSKNSSVWSVEEDAELARLQVRGRTPHLPWRVRRLPLLIFCYPER